MSCRRKQRQHNYTPASIAKPPPASPPNPDENRRPNNFVELQTQSYNPTNKYGVTLFEAKRTTPTMTRRRDEIRNQLNEFSLSDIHNHLFKSKSGSTIDTIQNYTD